MTTKGDRRKTPFEKIRLIDVPADELVGRILTTAQFREQVHVVPVNPHVFLKTIDDVSYEKIVTETQYAITDGVGIWMASRAFGQPLNYRITGTDLMVKLVKAAERDGLPIFLVGATDGTADACAQKLSLQFPGLKIAGVFEPPTVSSIEEIPESEIVEAINATRAEIVFVALGVPKQEEFIARNREKINARILMGVGASLDFLSGKKRRAPIWMRNIGLEWLFRLLHEPIRLGSRYLLGIPRFIWHIATMRFGRL